MWRRTDVIRHVHLCSQTRAVEAVRRLFCVSTNRTIAFEPKDAIFPGHTCAVRRTASTNSSNCRGDPCLSQPGKAPRRVTNTRNDKVHSGFRHWSAPTGDEARPLFASGVVISAPLESAESRSPFKCSLHPASPRPNAVPEGDASRERNDVAPHAERHVRRGVLPQWKSASIRMSPRPLIACARISAAEGRARRSHSLIRRRHR
jgi:hypothetical protein